MNCIPPLLASLCLAATALHAQEENMRTWTLDNGVAIQAAAISTPGKNIYLQKEGGRTIRIPLARLSAQDHAYLQTWKKPIPPATAPMLPHTLASSIDTMPIRTWRIGEGRTVQAAIQSLGPDDLIIRTDDDRLFNIQRNDLTAEETAHIEEWKQLNNIRNWTIYCSPQCTQPKKIEASIADTVQPTVVLRLLDGSQTIYRLQQFKGDDLATLQAWGTPNTRMEQTLVFQPDAASADADAKQHKRHIFVFLVGQKGSKEESLFEQFIWSNPYYIEYLNKTYTLIKYYCDENGNWPEIIKFQANKYKSPWYDSNHYEPMQILVLPTLTPIDHHYYRSSFTRYTVDPFDPVTHFSIMDPHFPYHLNPAPPANPGLSANPSS